MRKWGPEIEKDLLKDAKPVSAETEPRLRSINSNMHALSTICQIPLTKAPCEKKNQTSYMTLFG